MEPTPESSSRDRLSALVDQYLHLALSGRSGDVSTWIAEHHDLDSGERKRLQRTLEAISGDHIGGARAIVPAPGTPLDEPSPSRIGSYRLLRLLGRGAQGSVYLAVDTRHARQVAVKLLHPSVAPPGERDARASALRRLRREAEVTARLEHPGICAFCDVDLQGHVPFLAMRYVDGRSLAEHLATSRAAGIIPVALSRTGLSPDERVVEIVVLFEKIARALHAAHEAGVVHRDVKPSNVMVTPGGEPVLLDFGMAHDAQGVLSSLTATGDVVGSPAYMSPEQIDPRPGVIDRRTDVFSLGVTLYESLSLRRPFTARTREGLYAAIQTSAAIDPRRLNPVISRDLAVILETAMEKDPRRRYTTARELAEDLRRIRESRPIRARPMSRVRKFHRWARQSPKTATVVLALFFALIAALTQALWFVQREMRQGRQYRAMFFAASSSAALPEDPGLALLLAIESVETRPEHAGRSALYRALGELRETRSIRAYDLGAVNLEVSPDGRWLASSSSMNPEAGVRIWDRRDFGLVRTLPFQGTPCWSPDGSLLLISHEDSLLLDTSTWEVTGKFKGVGRPSFGHDGTWVLTRTASGEILVWACDAPGAPMFQAVSDAPIIEARLHPSAAQLFSIDADGVVRRWNLDTGEQQPLLTIHPTFPSTVGGPVLSPDGELLAVLDEREKMILLIDSQSGERHQRLAPQTAVVGWPAFSPDGLLLLTGHMDGTGVLWDVASGARRLNLAGHEGPVAGVGFSRSGRFALTRSGDHTVRIWDPGTGEALAVLRQEAGFSAVWLDEASMRAYTSGLNGTLREWSLETRGDEWTLHADGAGGPWMSVPSPDGGRLLVCWNDRVEIFEHGESLRSIALQMAQSAVWTPDGKGILTAERVAAIARMWDAETGALEVEYAGSGSPVWFAGIDPTGERVVTCPEDGLARVYDAETGRELGVLEGHAGGVRHAQFSRDGEWIVTTSEEDWTIRVWDARSFTCARTLREPERRPIFTTFSPDGSSLVSATWQGVALIWDWRSGRPVRELRGHKDWVRFAQYSPDGRLILTASEDGLIRLWEAESGEPHADLAGHEGEAYFACFDASGATIVSCGGDGTIRRWPVDVLGAARARKPRELWPEERRRFGLE